MSPSSKVQICATPHRVCNLCGSRNLLVNLQQSSAKVVACNNNNCRRARGRLSMLPYCAVCLSMLPYLKRDNNENRHFCARYPRRTPG